MSKPRVKDATVPKELFDVTIEAMKQLELSEKAHCERANANAAQLEQARRRIAELEADAERSIPKDDFIKWALDWRDIPEDQACKRCGGRGSIAYGNTATWRFGFGGSMMTSDVCNLCWGSGNEHRPWTDLRKMQPIAAQRQKEGK